MSIITGFLKLFKYDPETDGASTFNIKQCLNDNWDKIDAWASGIKTTIAGLVPGTRKINNKELSADVTLTGEDIKTSATDETTVSSSLSNLNTLVGGATTPQGALANLGAGVRPNLMINPFFEVNQRGQSSYGQGPTVDMWRLETDGNGKATVANDGIIISGNTGTYCNFEVGIEEVPPGTYTESFLVDDHTKVSQIYADEGGQFNITENLISYTFEVKSELDSVYWGIQKFLSAGDLKIFGAKLEEGSTQTLAYQDEAGAWQLLPQPESDYATQLAKCQRYQLELISKNDPQYACIGNGIGRTSGISGIECPIFIPTPITLRTRPVVTFNGNFYLQSGDSSLQVTRMALDRITTNGVNVLVYAENIEIGKFYSLYATISENHSLLLDANL